MNVEEQIEDYLSDQPQAKRNDMEAIHHIILQAMPEHKLWFLDGKNAEGKTVSNPNIGYGSRVIHYADGTSKEFYQIGLSANKTGISIYILGIKDKTYLAQTFEDRLGKADITGYCIKFKRLADLNTNVLKEAIRAGFKNESN